MAERVLFRDEFVPAADIDGNDLRCPRCRSNTLMLYGTSQMSRTEMLEQGQVTDVKLDEKSHAFEIEILECLMCCTRWHVKTKEVVALEQRVEELRQLLVKATGKDPFEVKGN